MRRRGRAALATACVLLAIDGKKKTKARKKIWVKDWIARRPERGSYQQICRELRSTDLVSFSNYMRLPSPLFQHILNLITPIIAKDPTMMRDPISPGMYYQINLIFVVNYYIFNQIESSAFYNYYNVSHFSICRYIAFANTIATILTSYHIYIHKSLASKIFVMNNINLDYLNCQQNLEFRIMV